MTPNMTSIDTVTIPAWALRDLLEHGKARSPEGSESAASYFRAALCADMQIEAKKMPRITSQPTLTTAPRIIAEPEQKPWYEHWFLADRDEAPWYGHWSVIVGIGACCLLAAMGWA